MSSKSFFFSTGLSILFLLSVNTPAQERPRVVGATTPQQQQSGSEVKVVSQQTTATEAKPSSSPVVSTQQAKPPSSKPQSAFVQLRAQMKEARQMLASHVVPTAYTDATSAPSIDFVTLAALEPSTSKIHLLTLAKKTFLTRDNEMKIATTQGALVTIRTVRANGVNTAVTIVDEKGKRFTPLLVQYPIEKNGKYTETAYYISVHPVLRSPEAVAAGKLYLKTTVDLAVKRLREKGKFISPDIIAVAERLCVVEHIDHIRYKTELRPDLYAEVYSLLAFNEGNTYRYAVSSAGAGGLVQMIPATYRMVRQKYPAMGLEPDFVVGMRNHVNAVQAMLLYMQDTWADLTANEEVLYALENNIATQAELLSAGYNSNPARLPLYLRRGGDAWRALIPRETQMYLDIYKTFETVMPSKPVVEQKPQSANNTQTKQTN
jgi:hypothetical protein